MKILSDIFGTGVVVIAAGSVLAAAVWLLWDKLIWGINQVLAAFREAEETGRGFSGTKT